MCTSTDVPGVAGVPLTSTVPAKRAGGAGGDDASAAVATKPPLATARRAKPATVDTAPPSNFFTLVILICSIPVIRPFVRQTPVPYPPALPVKTGTRGRGQSGFS